MAILGANFGESAIHKVGGGYYVSQPVKKTIQHTTVSVPKKPVYKAPAAPKVVAPKTVAAPAPSASIQTVSSPAVSASTTALTIDDLLNKYYNQSTGDVNSLYDKQKQSQMDQLKSQRDLAIGKINQQQTATKQDYYNQRNQADVVNAQNVQKLREIMASQGISASGDNLTLNAKANSDRQNVLGALNQQEQAKMNDYQSQITDWNNPARDQAITNQIEASRSQALLNAKQQAYQKAWNDWQFNNMSAAQQAQLAMGKYNTDSTNAATSAASQAALDYYNSMGFNGAGGGGGTAQYQKDMAKAISMGVDPSWSPVISQIVQRESSFNPNAKNPSSTAYGYGQFLDSTRKQYEAKTGLNYNDPSSQLVMMAQYIKDRYGTPQNALNFWLKNKWY